MNHFILHITHPFVLISGIVPPIGNNAADESALFVEISQSEKYRERIVQPLVVVVYYIYKKHPSNAGDAKIHNRLLRERRKNRGAITMCGRYQFSAAGYKDLQCILQDVQRRCQDSELKVRAGGDICPSAKAPVMIAIGNKVVGELQTWGLPSPRGNVIINARAETVTQKPMFRRSIAAQRCVIPTSGFYEWDSGKHQYLFQLSGQPIYLAGIYDNVEGANCFVILTTAPNASVAPVHDRMPLVLPREQIRSWLTDPLAAMELLGTTPPLLERACTDGQMSLGELL